MIPKAAPKATSVALLLALALCAVGIVAGRDALVEFGVVTGEAWIAPAIDSLTDLAVQPWMLPAGIAVAVLGAVLVVLALLPRRTTHRPSDAEGVLIGRKPGHARISTIGTASAVTDRTATVVFGALLVAVGGGAAAWERGRLPDGVRTARGTVDSWQPTDWAAAAWWPWALTGVAAVTVLLGLRWLYAHRPRRGASRVATEVDPNARVDLASAARSAAADFASTEGIGSATARVVKRRSKSVLRVRGIAGDDTRTIDDLVDAGSRFRTRCLAALDGTPVEVEVLIDSTRRPA